MMRETVRLWTPAMAVRGIGVVLALVALAGCSTVPADQKDPAWQATMDGAIERYIKTHPEVIEQSLQALEAKREAEEKARQKVALAQRQGDLLNDPASPVSGNPKGKLTLVEFFDYRCGYCKRAAGAVTQLQKDDPQVRVVYKDFPILGEASELAAKAALASRAQGKHQAFHEALLASKNELTRDELLRIAVDVGLEAARLDADMASPEWQTIIERNRSLAKDLGITGTPAFIVGTEFAPGALDLKGLKDLLARAGRNE